MNVKIRKINLLHNPGKLNYAPHVLIPQHTVNTTSIMRLWIIWPCNTAVSMSLVTPAYNLKMAHVLTPARHNKLKTWLHLIHFAIIHTVNLSVVDTILHDSPDLVIHKTDIWAVWRPQVGPKNVWCFLTQQFNCCTCRVHCAGALSCWNTKFVTSRHSAYCWHDVIMQHRRRQ